MITLTHLLINILQIKQSTSTFFLYRLKKKVLYYIVDFCWSYKIMTVITQFSSFQDSTVKLSKPIIYAPGKTSLRNFLNVALEKVPILVEYQPLPFQNLFPPELIGQLN